MFFEGFIYFLSCLGYQWDQNTHEISLDFPGRILVVGRQVGLPEDLPKDEQFDEAEGHQKAVHLLQGHRDSFLYFMRFQLSVFFLLRNDMSRHLGWEVCENGRKFGVIDFPYYISRSKPDGIGHIS